MGKRKLQCKNNVAAATAAAAAPPQVKFSKLRRFTSAANFVVFPKKTFFPNFFFLGLKEHLLFSSFTQKIFFYLNVYYPKNEFQKIGKSGTKPTFTIRDDAKCFPVVSSHYCF